jgi:hypothetical protein
MLEEKIIFNDDYDEIERRMSVMCPEGTPIELKNRLRGWLEAEARSKMIWKMASAPFKEFIPKNNCDKCNDRWYLV